ncbi:MAG: HupE/UreJ family protein [Boseongicola sp.]
MMRLLLILVLAMLAPSEIKAHALQPGYLELRVLDDDNWSVFFRKPDVSGSPMEIYARLGAPCTSPEDQDAVFDGAGWSARWISRCPGGLTGATIEIEGLEKTSTDVLVRYELEAGQGQAWRLVPTATSFAVPTDPGVGEVLVSYFKLGIEHILFGYDHLLFVLAMLILIRDLRVLIGAITAFTVAHSFTLGAAALGWLAIPGPPVEAIIALSIMFVASEILHRDPDKPRLSERMPWVVSFGFGLIHGLGFGSALSEIGLPQNEVVPALLAINIGVEAGQILFIVAVHLCWALVKNVGFSAPVARFQNGLVVCIGGVAAFWFIERLAGF